MNDDVNDDVNDDAFEEEKARIADACFMEALEKAEKAGVPAQLFMVNAISKSLAAMFNPEMEGNPEALRYLVNDILDDLEGVED